MNINAKDIATWLHKTHGYRIDIIEGTSMTLKVSGNTVLYGLTDCCLLFGYVWDDEDEDEGFHVNKQGLLRAVGPTGHVTHTVTSPITNHKYGITFVTEEGMSKLLSCNSSDERVQRVSARLEDAKQFVKQRHHFMLN